MDKRNLLMLGLAAMLAGCAAAVPSPPAASTPTSPAVPRSDPVIAVPPPPDAQLLRLPGLESVIGATAAGLTAQFGQPRLNVQEGDARKLQFSGTACVLDVYLYPARPGAEPSATYVDARRASDGRDVDRAACVAALKRR